MFLKKSCLVLLVCLIAVVCCQQSSVNEEAVVRSTPPSGLRQAQDMRSAPSGHRQDIVFENEDLDSRMQIQNLLALVIPKIQRNVHTLMTNVAQAVAGAVATTVSNGFKPLKITFIPLGKSSLSGFTLEGLDGKPMVYVGEAPLRDSKPETQRKRPYPTLPIAH